MSDKLYRNEAWLREQYLTNKESCNGIAKIVGCNAVTIFSWLKKFDIPRRDYSESVKGIHHGEDSKQRHSAANKRRWAEHNNNTCYQNKEWLIFQYHTSNKSVCKIAKENGVAPFTITKWIKKNEIPIKPKPIPKHPVCLRGLGWTPEARAKKSAQMLGRKVPDEIKEKMRRAAKTRNQRPEYIEKQRSAKKGAKNPAWLGGISFGEYCPKFDEKFKESVRNRFDRKCYLCPTIENGRRLSVHHIDYNHNSICNGKEWAFVPLCNKCHPLTNFNRWYWFNKLIYYWLDNPDIHFGLSGSVGLL